MNSQNAQTYVWLLLATPQISLINTPYVGWVVWSNLKCLSLPAACAIVSINECPGFDFNLIEYSLSTSSPIHNVYEHFTLREWWEDSCDDDSLDDDDEDDDSEDELDDELDELEDASDNAQMNATKNKMNKIFIACSIFRWLHPDS